MLFPVKFIAINVAKDVDSIMLEENFMAANT